MQIIDAATNTIKDPETLKAEAVKDFSLLQRTLREAEFIGLDPEAQEATLKEAERLLFGPGLESSPKRQLLEFVKNLDVSTKVSEKTRQQTAAIIDKWNVPPF